MKSKPMVAVVRLQGLIASGNRGALSDQSVAPLLERAFSKGKPKAVALVINSPGGSPVQSSLIGARIQRLADKHDVPVIAFVEDVAASGGYWLAAAADEIYADPCSIVGSIGVISAGFGLQDLIGRYGIERRVYTAGQSKSQLDPFRAENPEDVARLKGLLEDIHQEFISHVKACRSKRLDPEADLFNGEVWLAAKAKSLGLIDGIGHVGSIMRERFGENVRFKAYGMRRPLLRRIGGQMIQDAVGVAEERAAYARFGL